MSKDVPVICRDGHGEWHGRSNTISWRARSGKALALNIFRSLGSMTLSATSYSVPCPTLAPGAPAPCACPCATVKPRPSPHPI